MIEKITRERLDLRPKLILAFVLVTLLVAVTGAAGYASIAAVDDQANLIAADEQKMDAAASVVVIQEQQAAVLNAQLSTFEIREDATVEISDPVDPAGKSSAPAQADGGYSHEENRDTR